MEVKNKVIQDERRAHHRSIIPDGTLFVKNSESDEQLGKVLDISLGGISFIYDQNGNPPEESNRLDIYSVENDHCIRRIPYQNVNDYEFSDGYPFEITRRRRRGIQFHELTVKQIGQIETLIRTTTF